ncbi:MAG: GspH/FimT family pseudopilin [Pseudomonadota bacterium]
MNGRPDSQGFTLVELMVTVAVLTILISVGVPMYGQFTQGSAISSATSELVTSLNVARSEAVTRRESVRMERIDDNWTNGWQLLLDADDTLIREVRGVDKGKAAIGEASDLDSLVFDGQGRVSSNAEFTVGLKGADTANGRVLTLSRFGRTELSVEEVECFAHCP